MRVLVTTAPGYGHLGPMLPMARALGGAGHVVAVATSGDFHPVVRGAGLEPLAAGLSESALQDRRRRIWPETERQPPRDWAVRMFARIAAPAMLVDLRRIVREWGPDLVVHEEGELAGPAAAAGAGVPWVTHGWGSPLRLPDALAQLALDTADVWQTVGVVPPPFGGLYTHAVVDPCPTSLQPRAGEVPTRLTVRFEPFGSSAAASTGPPVRPAAGSRPQAYVSFGTVPLYRDAPDLLTMIVRGLAQAGFDVLVTVESAAEGEALARLDPVQVRVERFVSLPAVLPHCSLVVCHGGAGTTLAALLHGLPLVLVPRGAPSQARMAHACERAGVGLSLNAIELDASAFGEALRAVAGQPSYRRRAESIALEMRSMPAAPSVVPALEALVATVAGGRAPTRGH